MFFKRLNADNPYNVEYVIEPDNLDETKGQAVKMDSLVINTDVVRIIKMLCDVGSGWGDEYPETVDEYFHPQNLTLSVRSSLGITFNT